MVDQTAKKTGRRASGILLRWIIACLGFAASLAAHASDFSYVCENSGLTRSVEVVTPPGYACRVRYTRKSGTTYPWNARNQADYCQPKARGLVDRLVSWGWQCDSNADVESILNAQLERYQRHLAILGNVGKTCHLYPSEIQFGNLCGDERHEGAIVYTCESEADSWEQHLAVFLELENEPLIEEVGDSRFRQVTAWHIENRRLALEIQPFAAAENGAADRATTELEYYRCNLNESSKWILQRQ